MNNLVVPSWNNLKYQIQVGVEEREESNRSSHVLMDNNEVTELTWENGQLAIHGLSGLLQNKPTWGRAGDTLESIVHQGTTSYNNQNNNNREQLLPQHHPYRFDPPHSSSTVSFSTENPGFTYGESRPDNKRKRLEPYLNFENSFQDERGSACASDSAVFSRENDATTLMTWTSLEEDPPSLKAKPKDDDSAYHDGSENRDQVEQRDTKGESSRSKSTRPDRAAANHNQSERRRRDRINQKMKALQKLVPNASKSDKASMLDEVIEYLKQLQAQVKMMNPRALPQMMMPTFEMQRQMQMSLLARMGMGAGLGLAHAGHTPTQPLPQVIHPAQIGGVSASQFFPQPFMMPQVMPNNTRNATTINNSAHVNNPYFPYFAQPMNMDLYSKMATMYQQQLNQTNQQTSNPLPHDNNVQRS